MGHKKLTIPEQGHPGRSEKNSPVQAKLAAGGNRDLLSQLGSAKTMPESVQAKMEDTLGADFSEVKLYESPLVARGGAEAAASGNNIAFAPGKLDLSSAGGRALLGHELSHVVSQARGEVSGSGFVNNSALERRADADGAKAADALDASDLAPMGAGMADMSAGAPVQAKKGKSAFEEEYEQQQDLSQQVSFLANEAMNRDSLTAEDMSKYRGRGDAFAKMVPMDNMDFVKEMYSQMQDASVIFQDEYNEKLASNMSQDEAVFRMQNSEAGEKLMGYMALMSYMAFNGKDDDEGGAYARYASEQIERGDLSEQEQARIEAMELSMGIINGSSRSEWTKNNPEEVARVKSESDERSRRRREHVVEQEKKKKGFWARLFGR